MASNKTRAKVYWTGTCNQKRHGRPGYKSTHGFNFIGVAVPRNKREQNTVGCVACKREDRE